MTRLLRDYFQGTPYDLSKGLAAGPFGMPMRWGGDEKGVVGGWERPISMYRTVFSFVLQARAHLPDAVGGVAWYGQSSPHASVYVPFSCAQEEVPLAYVLGKESEFTHGSAWWAFSFVNNWSMIRFDAISRDIRARIAELQKACFAERKMMEHHVIHTDTMTASEVRAYLQGQSNRLASRVVDEWWTLLGNLWVNSRTGISRQERLRRKWRCLVTRSGGSSLVNSPNGQVKRWCRRTFQSCRSSLSCLKAARM